MPHITLISYFISETILKLCETHLRILEKELEEKNINFEPLLPKNFISVKISFRLESRRQQKDTNPNISLRRHFLCYARTLSICLVFNLEPNELCTN